MSFEKIVGHEKIINGLRDVAKKKSRRSQSLLFSGPSGIGKKLVALAWAQAVLCKVEKDCEGCSSCKRVLSLKHPDLLIVSPGDSPTLKIDQIRQLQNFVALKSFEGGGKVVIIDEAHQMTAQASNALLKTLEEPPENTYFVLITSNRGAILPTIQSRCQKILFGHLSQAELKKIVPDAEDWCFALSQGRVELVTRFMDKEHKAKRILAMRFLKDIPDSKLYEGFTQTLKLSDDRESSLFTTHCWAQALKVSLSQALGAEVSGLSDENETLDSLKKNFSVPALIKLSQNLLRLEQDINANVNKSLAFENFFIDAKALKGSR